jgi:hypothetical protein
MSTRSFICVEDTVQGYRGVYCHYDGYPSHVGKILAGYHSSMTSALEIVHGPQIRNFDHDGTIVRFGDGTPDDSEVYLGIDDALGSGFDYVYLFEDGRWKCFGHDRGIYHKITREYDIPGQE